MENFASKTDNQLAVDRTYMAMARTLMAADQTLMSWIRTGILIMGCGFIIYKELLFLNESLPGHPIMSQEPRRFGLFLITMGTLCMLFGLLDHYRTTRQFAPESRYSPWNFAFIIAISAMFMGFFLLTSILTRTEIF